MRYVFFTDRTEAGKLLAKALEKYKHTDVVVYALPRGGVVVAIEIAKYLNAPLDLIIPRKIGHPYQPEYAIAAITESGYIVGNKKELDSIDQVWLDLQIEKERKEAKRRRLAYLQNREEIPVRGKIAILVDDGVATGLTMRAAILELKEKQPGKIIIAVPIIPESTMERLMQEADEVVAIDVPSDHGFLGAIGSYYFQFLPVRDKEVINILNSYEREKSNYPSSYTLSG